ncbi:translation elongation factor Ts [Candidatus Woesebacteria bacterium]|nr:translation elongation factor Ts [Candidatus Woesebacteria bacterium]
MSVDYNVLKKLRKETGVSFALCKKALEETDNAYKKAQNLLNEWGVEKAEKKADRQTADGALFSYIHHNKKIASLLEMRSETDFVSGNDEFRSLGQELAMQVASVPAESVEEFLKQPYIREPGKTIEQLVKEAILKFGENIQISRLVRWELGEEK